jgi:3D (Asp-Asp-Asp) domain-containing protein
MIYRTLSLSALACVAALFTSCGSTDGPTLISKSSIQSGSYTTINRPLAKRESFALPAASTTAVSAAAGKPRDKHSMPVYSFADRTRIVRTTAYTCSESDHLIYGNKNATGTTLRYTDRVRSAAADWSFYPVGTQFRIKGLPYLYVVDDYGSALLGTGTVDIYTPTKGVMGDWGTRNIEMQVVQWGSFTRSAELLKQRTGYDHCRKMLANIVRQQPSLASSVAKN